MSVELNKKAELEEFIKDDGKVAVWKLGAEWCAPCAAMKPDIEAFATENEAKVKIASVDVDAYEENNDDDIQEEYEVEGLPFFIIFKGGEKVETYMGSKTDVVKEMILKHVS